MGIVWRFLRAPRGITFDVLNVVALAFGFDDPRGNGGVNDAILVEVENHFFTLLDFGCHDVLITL